MKFQKVKIAAHTYNLIYPYCFRERFDYCGQADHSLCEIRIVNHDNCGNTRPYSNILVTFFHEIIHAIDRAYCMDMLGGDNKEQITEALAQGFTQVMLDNNLLNREKFDID